MKNFLLIIIAFLLLIDTQIKAQSTTINFCDKVNYIDANLNEKLQLFPEYPTFILANLYLENEEYFLEILYQENQQVVTNKSKISEEQLSELCKKINPKKNKVAEKKIKEPLDQSGRKNLVAKSGLLGFFLYSPTISFLSYPRNTGNLYTSYAVTSGVSMAVPYLLTMNRTVTTSMAKSYTYGALLGFSHGFASLGILRTDSPLTPIAFSVGEGALFYHLARKYEWTDSQASMLGSLGLWSFGLGAALPTNAPYYQQPFVSLSLGSIFSVGGILTGLLINKINPVYTQDDVVAMNTFIFAGLLISQAINFSIDPNYLITLFPDINTLQYSLFTLCSVTGLAYGLYHGNKYDLDNKGSSLIMLSGLAGSLGGLAILASTGVEVTNSQFYWSVGAGFTVGMLTLGIFRKKNFFTNLSVNGWSFDVNLMGLRSSFTDSNDLQIEKYQRQPDVLMAKFKF